MVVAKQPTNHNVITQIYNNYLYLYYSLTVLTVAVKKVAVVYRSSIISLQSKKKKRNLANSLNTASRPTSSDSLP